MNPARHHPSVEGDARVWGGKEEQMAHTGREGERGSTPEQTGEHYDSLGQGQGQYPGWQPPGCEYPPDLYDAGQYEANSAGYSGLYGGAQYGQAPYEAPRVPGAEVGGAESWRFPGPFTGRGPRNYQRSDERIWEDVCDRLTQAGQLDASDIEVRVSRGEITLAGQVDSQQSKHMAEDIAEGVPGVRDMHDQIIVRERPVDKANDELTPGGENGQGH
jgi:BON domain-containing protein